MLIASDAATVPLYDCDAVTELPSVAVIVKVYAPETLVVPVIAPVDALSESPAGNAPDVTVNEIGAVPPEVCTVWLYAVLMSGVDSVPVVIASEETMVPLYACDAVIELLSVAVIVKLYVPALVGVPVIAPVDALSVRPLGSAPDVTLNVTGAVPPDVCTVWLYAM